MELISLIVPVYRVERYLERCVQSILSQTYKNIEIILVDDGSPDESGKMCDVIASKDDRIHVIHKENGGLSSARNAGLDIAKGDYICFVDSDDYIEKDYVSTLLRLINKYSADLAKIDYIEIDVDNYTEKTVAPKEVFFQKKDIEQAFLDLKVDSACVFMYKKQLIGDIRFPVGKTSEDIPFNFEIFQRATRFVYAPVNKYYYYHNPDSISNGPLDKNMLNYLAFRKDIYDFYGDKGNQALSKKAEILYARAAMGLKARMALYGISKNMDEKEYKERFDNVFKKHKKSFFSDKNTALSRKILAILVFDFYPVAKMLRILFK